MQKPEDLKKFIERNFDHAELIKTGIKIFCENERYRRTMICAICGIELTQQERQSIRHTHYHFTCNEHRKYAHHFMIDSIRNELGFDKPEIDQYL